MEVDKACDARYCREVEEESYRMGSKTWQKKQKKTDTRWEMSQTSQQDLIGEELPKTGNNKNREEDLDNNDVSVSKAQPNTSNKNVHFGNMEEGKKSKLIPNSNKKIYGKGI
ncbi:hypothetical protein EVAR_8716_1 [Eumeta japonica]|uniref:Uncharacterized protein n=1 Tax=Eumeta variegata TaxID=151549 RepID=A0A4C1XNE0_EUMVA|nr:hypothetical protein EVAR_8716_1 [Eumeta japonica]